MAGIARRAGAGTGVWLASTSYWLLEGLALGVGYWLSDRAYDAGLWPVGAVMRIFLLFGLLGWGLHAIYLVIMLAAVLWLTVAGGPERD